MCWFVFDGRSFTGRVSVAQDALGEAELGYSPTPRDFTLFSDRLPEVLADSNDATTHASWLTVSLFFLIR